MLRNFVAFFLQMATEYRNNVSWQKNSPTIAANRLNGVLGRPAIRSSFVGVNAVFQILPKPFNAPEKWNIFDDRVKVIGSAGSLIEAKVWCEKNR